MTLIALMLTDAGPVLFGDLLLSANVPNRGITLPTVGVVTPEHVPISDAFSPVGMGSKIVIVSNDVAFAWAGSHHLASLFAHSLANLVQHGSISAATVDQAVDNVVSFETADEKVTLLVACHEGESSTTRSQGSTKSGSLGAARRSWRRRWGRSA